MWEPLHVVPRFPSRVAAILIIFSLLAAVALYRSGLVIEYKVAGWFFIAFYSLWIVYYLQRQLPQKLILEGKRCLLYLYSGDVLTTRLDGMQWVYSHWVVLRVKGSSKTRYVLLELHGIDPDAARRLRIRLRHPN